MEAGMSGQSLWFVGLDWARERHRVCLLDAEGRRVAERDVTHEGAALSELCRWLVAKSGSPPAQIAVAIETPRGPVVETLLERGFAVFSINPKQLDRFRDRFTVAGAKDDSRDALVLGHSLRTDPAAFRALSTDDPLVIDLREWSRIHDELTQERTRLSNRLRDQLWRYYPQAFELGDDVADSWFLDLWEQVPTPAEAARVSEKAVARILKDHRIRRIDAPEALRILRQQPLVVAPGTVQAASAHIRTLAARLRLINQQLKEADRRLDQLCEAIAASGETAPGADLRAARHCDPAFLSRARKDQHRRAARRGLRASAAERLPRLENAVGGRPGDPPQRQDLLRSAAICLQQSTAQCRPPVGVDRSSPRSTQQATLCRLAAPRPRPRAGTAQCR
jgi:hypothetical protein